MPRTTLADGLSWMTQGSAYVKQSHAWLLFTCAGPASLRCWVLGSSDTCKAVRAREDVNSEGSVQLPETAPRLTLFMTPSTRTSDSASLSTCKLASASTGQVEHRRQANNIPAYRTCTSCATHSRPSCTTCELRHGVAKHAATLEGSESAGREEDVGEEGKCGYCA